MTKQVSLWANGECIELDYFVSSFIDHTVGGMIASLKGTGDIGTLELTIEGGQADIKLNNAQVPANPFVSKIIHNTVMGMAATLKGVPKKVETLKIAITR